MRFLPITAAGALLLAGSLSVYAQTQTEQKPEQPGMNTGQQQERKPSAEGAKPAASGAEQRSDGRSQEGSGQRDAQRPDRDDGDRSTNQQQGKSEEKPAGEAKDGDRAESSRDDASKEGRGETSKEGRADASKERGADAAKDSRADASKDEGKRAERSGGEGGKSKAKQREASSKLKPQQKTVIKKTIVERNVRPAKVDFSVSVGSVVPRTVVLYDLPPVIIEVAPDYREYKYVLADNDTIIVIDPDTWEIVDVIQI